MLKPTAFNHTPVSRGILIAVEGIDGAGKTTLARTLTGALIDQGHDVLLTKEPTNGPWGQKIRRSAAGERMSPTEELFAFVWDRMAHVRDVLLPALEAGRIVIVDRYYFSTVAYQGARGFATADLYALNAFAPPPQLLIHLDVEPIEGLARIRGRGDKPDVFEDPESLTRVAAIFREMDFPYLCRFDARQKVEGIVDAVLKILLDNHLLHSGQTGPS